MKCSYIVLAAGFSNRFGQEDKRESLWDGKPLLMHVVSQLPVNTHDEVVVVVRDADKWSLLENERHIRLVENKHAENGMPSSLKVGLNQMSAESSCFVVCLADMPLLNADHYLNLRQFFEDQATAARHPLIVMPRVNGADVGHPRLFSKEFLVPFLSSEDNQTNKKIINHHQTSVIYFETNDQAFLGDIDTKDDKNRLER